LNEGSYLLKTPRPFDRIVKATPAFKGEGTLPGVLARWPKKGAALQQGARLFQSHDLVVNLSQSLKESHGSSIRLCDVVVRPGFAKPGTDWRASGYEDTFSF